MSLKQVLKAVYFIGAIVVSAITVYGVVGAAIWVASAVKGTVGIVAGLATFSGLAYVAIKSAEFIDNSVNNFINNLPDPNSSTNLFDNFIWQDNFPDVYHHKEVIEKPSYMELLKLSFNYN